MMRAVLPAVALGCVLFHGTARRVAGVCLQTPEIAGHVAPHSRGFADETPATHRAG
jgi:hypothetical protein